MLTALDHVALVVRDVNAAADRYSALLGCEPSWRATDGGAEHAWIPLANTALHLMAPIEKGVWGTRLQAHLDRYGEGIWALAFATADIATSRHVLARRGIDLTEASPIRVQQVSTGVPHEWTTHTLAPSATFGTTILLIERTPGAAPLQQSRHATHEPGVTGLDHVVVTTAHPERAAALYGARLGLDLKLDRTNPDWNARLMFFKCADLIVEVAHTLKNSDPSADDKVWGLSWRVTDVGAAHTRMKGEGFNLSEIRTGRKPGTSVFTVRDAPGGVPTLVIGRT